MPGRDGTSTVLEGGRRRRRRHGGWRPGVAGSSSHEATARSSLADLRFVRYPGDMTWPTDKPRLEQDRPLGFLDRDRPGAGTEHTLRYVSHVLWYILLVLRLCRGCRRHLGYWRQGEQGMSRTRKVNVRRLSGARSHPGHSRTCWDHHRRPARACAGMRGLRRRLRERLGLEVRVRLRPLYVTAFLQGLVLSYAIEKPGSSLKVAWLSSRGTGRAALSNCRCLAAWRRENARVGSP